MSKYDDVVVSTRRPAFERVFGGVASSGFIVERHMNRDALKAALEDIDARLAKLEAEAQATSKHVSNLDIRTIGSFAVGGNGYTGGLMDLAMSKPTPSPTQPQREPGLYTVQLPNGIFAVRLWAKTGRWLNQSGYKPNDSGEYAWIGPRVQPPEGAV